MKEKSKVQFILFCILLFLPAVFSPWGDSVFIIPKIFFLKIITLTLLCTIFVRWGHENIFIIPRDFLLLPLFIFLLAKTLSTVFSLHLQTSHQELENQLFYILFYFCGLFVLSEPARRDISIVIVIIVATLISGYALLQTGGLDFVVWNDPTVFVRPSSSLGNPNFLAAYLSIMLPFLFYQLFCSIRFISKFFLSLSTVVVLTALLHTYTRGGWLAATLSLLVFFFFSDKKEIKKNLSYLTFILIIISVIFFHLNQRKIEIEHQKVNLFERATRFSPSALVRLNLWNDSLYLIRDGFPLGFGLDTYPLCYPKRRSVEILRLQIETALPENAHNELLQTATCEGMLGLFSYLFLLLVLFFRAIKNARCRKNNLLDITLFSSLLAYFIQSLVNPKIIDIKFLFYFLAILVSFQNRGSQIIYSFSESSLRAKMVSSALVLSIIITLVPFFFRPVLADRYFRKAMDSLHRQENEKALIFLHKAIYLNLSSSHYLRQAAMFTRKIAEASKDEKIFKEAIELYKMAEKINPRDASIHSDLGRLYTSYSLTLNQNKFTEAVSAYQKAISLDPKFPIFHNDLGITYMNSGNFKEAEKCFRITMDIVPDFWEPYFNMGILYFRQGEKDKAISWAKKSIIKKPDNLEGWGNLIFFLKTYERYDEALLWLKKARKQFPLDKNFKTQFEVMKKEMNTR